MNKSVRNIVYKLALTCFFVFLLYGFFSFVGSETVSAQGDTFGVAKIDETVNLGAQDIRVTVAKIIRIFLSLLGIIALGIILYGGYIYMTAGGSEDKILQARKILINGTIGLAIILSSLAITQFVLSKLAEANGIDLGGGGGGGCKTVAECNGGGGGYGSCFEQHFVVKSITPSQEETDMNNIVIRAVFSKALGSAPGDALKIYQGNNELTKTDITSSFTITFADDSKKVIKAVYVPPAGEENCADENKTEGQTCLTVSDSKYLVEVPKNIQSANGEKLEEGKVCGVETFTEVDFGVNQKVNDKTAPVYKTDIQFILPDGNPSTEQGIKLYQNATYPIEFTVEDDSGIGYTQVRIASENGADVFDLYDGPYKDKSAEAFTFSYPLFLGSGIPAKTKYTVTATTFDIDHNSAQKESYFFVYPGHCANGELDKDKEETDVDKGGPCGAEEGAYCDASTPCSAGLKCVNNVCVQYPQITDIVPQDGAPGNWISILGNYFGAKPGKVEFATDINLDGIYEDSEWIQASLAQCSEVIKSTWQDSFVVVEVPKGTPKGNAVSFNGSASLSLSPSPLYKETSSSFSVSTWVKAEESAGFGIIAGGGLAKTGGWSLYLGTLQDASKQINFEMYDPGVSKYRRLALPFSVGVFHHVAASFDAATGQIALYVDGKAVKTANLSGGSLTQSNLNTITLGKRSVFNPFYFKGSIDEFLIYESVLTDGQVIALSDPFAGLDHAKDTALSFAPSLYLRFYSPVLSNLAAGKPSFNVAAEGNPLFNQNGIFGSYGSLGQINAIRVSRGDDPSLFDLSDDAFGPAPVPGPDAAAKGYMTKQEYDQITGGRPGYFIKNDITRPGLCAVVTADSYKFSSALPNTPIQAYGKSFGAIKGGTSNLDFGGVIAQVDPNKWTDTFLQSAVPFNTALGKIPVTVQAGGQTSNAIPFQVLAGDLKDLVPIIESIDPASSTPASYITILGKNFGESTGIVYLTTEKGHECKPDDTSCTQANATLPVYCKDTWSDSQIIVQIPEEMASSTYYLIVQRGDGPLRSDGLDTFGVYEGPALPSICLLDPSSGPAPLPGDSEGLYIRGYGFSTDPTVYYWQNGAQAGALGTWLNSDQDTFGGQSVILQSVDTLVRTLLPVDVGTGLSMQSGLIKVQSDSDQVSNGVLYTVSDCRVVGSKAPGTGYTCCTEGPGAGQWIGNGYVCPGETRDAGYVWRFTTGLIPNRPYVLESCNVANWNKLDFQQEFPSPTPWEENLKLGEASCKNASIAVRFSMSMDESTLTSNNIKVYACGTAEDGSMDCSAQKEALDNLDLKLENEVLIIKENDSPETYLEPNTWYNVELSKDIKSEETVQLLGESITQSGSLKETRPCGAGTAYCFSFKTNDNLCVLSNAGINPIEYTADKLGTVQDPKYPVQDMEDIFEVPANPLHYFINGYGDQECSVLPVDGKGWVWDSSDFAKATAHNWPNPPEYTDTRGIAKAKEDTGITPVHIEAEAEIVVKEAPEGSEEKPATIALSPYSLLNIILGDPKVTYWEPDCSESCINASIAAHFNRHMDPSTYEAGFAFFKCDNANCAKPIQVPNSAYALDISSKLKLVVDPESLDKNTYYKVRLSAAIKSIDFINADKSIKQGKALQPFEWIFKTKNDATPCAANDLKVEPNPFTAYGIGEKTKYTVVPYSSPNECSKYGQKLNKWDYGYDWYTPEDKDEAPNNNVASVSNFHTGFGWSAFCSPLCLPKGSDLSNAVLSTFPLCGNGDKDPGEDCDLSEENADGTLKWAEGVCQINCLFTSSTPQGSALKGSLPYSQFNSELVGQSWCGDGEVGLGEACDTALSYEEAADKSQSNIFCTEACLHSGTQLAAYWCEEKSSKTKEEATACAAALSICGNAVIEDGEECEIISNKVYVAGDYAGNVMIETNAAKAACGPRCLLQGNICLTNIPEYSSAQQNGFRCQKGSEGCSDECQLLGSSPKYSSSSICGDGLATGGKVGLGEYGQCEKAGEAVSFNFTSSSPVQVATAIGQGAVVKGKQNTDITVKLDGNPGIPNDASGSGDYTLQCGYTEFKEPKADEQYNDCVVSGGNGGNVYGVAYNSCCALRPLRYEEYPLDQAGIENSDTAVCRNTYIEARFDKEIEVDSLNNNIAIVKGHPEAGYDCSNSGGYNVTEKVQDAMGINTKILKSDGGFFYQIWKSIKAFFAMLFNKIALALPYYEIKDLTDVETWCAGEIPLSFEAKTLSSPGESETSKNSVLSIYISKLLDENSIYAVLLNGGLTGIRDIDGVGIKNADSLLLIRDDIWVFKTGNEICKIKDITVNPDSYLFNKPSQAKDFNVKAESTNGQHIVPIKGVYDWVWKWDPVNNIIFDIPDVNKADNIISSKDVEGHINGIVAAEIITDKGEDSQEGFRFTKVMDLTANFCENPWPAFEADGSWSPWKDEKYNFSMSYCADAGNAGDTSDDLPLLSKVFEIQNEQDVQVKVPGNCLLAPETTCLEDSQCDPLYNLPAVNISAGYPMYTPQCKLGLSATELKANACKLFSSATGKFCIKTEANGNIKYYGSSYLSCSANADCAIGETCMAAGSSWKVEDSCAGIAFETDEGKKLLAQDVLRKVLFFNDKENNKDVLGLQIFKNIDGEEKAKSLSAWYADKFEDLGVMQQKNVAGYEALNDNSNYYINALNFVEDGALSDIFNNVYLFSINPDADSSTKDVFEQFVSSLEFNTNLSDHKYCMAGDSFDIRFEEDVNNISDKICETDFDCRDAGGAALVDAGGLSVTSGICSNAKTKFFRDWARLPSIGQALENINTHFSTNEGLPTFKGDLKSGTFVPGYTVSKWPSWSATLAASVGGLPVDPINRWSSCGLCLGGSSEEQGIFVGCASDQDCPGANDSCVLQNPQTCWNESKSLYMCPAFSSVYEYEYQKDTQGYLLHGNLEFFNLDDEIVKGLIDTQSFTDEQWCQSNLPLPVNPFDETCGNGIVGPGEECDPPGQIFYSQAGNIAQKEGSCALDPNISCISAAADCPKYINLEGAGMLITDQEGVCAKLKSSNNQDLIYDHFASKLEPGNFKLVGYGCSTDTECKKSEYYKGAPSKVNVLDLENAGFKIMSADEFKQYVTANEEILTCIKGVSWKNDECIGAVQGGFGQCSAGSIAKKICTSECKTEYGLCTASYVCGNGVVESGEKCDDGALNGTYGHCADSKSALPDGTKVGACQGLHPAYCGDGTVQAGKEVCDIAEAKYADKSGYCKYANTICQGDWACNVNLICTDGACYDSNGKALGLSCSQNSDCVDTCLKDPSYHLLSEYSCAANCKSVGNYCGDGSIQYEYEICDDGNKTDGDGCNTYCEVEEVTLLCGNGKKEGAETCDDGNKTDGDGCSSSCTVEIAKAECGNGKMEQDIGEACDLGKDKNGVKCSPAYGKSCNYCSLDCKNILTIDSGEFCGDGLISGPEKCEPFSSTAILVPQTLAEVQDICLAQTQAQTCENDCEKHFQSSWKYGEETLDGYICQNTANLSNRIKVAYGHAPEGVPDTYYGFPIGGVNSGTNISFSSFTKWNEYTEPAKEICNKLYGTSAQPLPFKLTPWEDNPDADAFMEKVLVNDVQCKLDCVAAYDACVAEKSQANSKQLVCNSGADYTNKGSWVCSPDCLGEPVNQCVACGLKTFGPEPLLALLNPMVDPFTDGDTQSLGSGFNWTKLANYDLSLGRKQLTTEGGLGAVFSLEPNDISLIVVKTPSNSFSITNGNNIEGDLLCKEEYALSFNKLAIQNATGIKGSKTQYNAGLKNFFDYPVNGEKDKIVNDLVISPAVPPGVARVVIRWTAEENKKGAVFAGGLYSSRLAKIAGGDPSKAIIRYADAKVEINPLQHLCKFMVKINRTVQTDTGPATHEYWMPAPLNGSGCTGVNGVYVHEIAGTEKTFIQSFTIDAEKIIVTDKPHSYGFFVEAIDDILGSYTNSNLQVDVYSYHKGQVPLYSLYQPDYSFSIKNAAASSSNTLAPYWHVFNLLVEYAGTPGIYTYSIDPVETIETDICQIKENMPLPPEEKCSL